MSYSDAFGRKFGTLLFVTLALTSCTDNQKHASEPIDKKPAQGDQVAETETVLVTSHRLKRTIRIPSELAAFRDVKIYPKVQGFVKSMKVDRGAVVKRGQTLVEIVAPELDANYGEAQAKYEAVQSSLSETQSKIASLVAQKEEAQAKLAADEAGYKRIQHAAKTTGAVAPVDLEAAEQKVQGDQARVRSATQMVKAAQAALQAERERVKGVQQALNSVRETKSYLTIRAPFDGVITERNVHEGSLVSSSSSNPPLLKIEQISPLRLLVPVPESAISGVRNGSVMKFTTAAFVGKEFSGIVSRMSHDLDRKTRTMIVELDVPNATGELEPGMYAEAIWQMERPYQTLFVPAAAILSREDKTFVSLVKNQNAELVQVSRGQPMGKLVEIVGNIKAGDEVVMHPTGELKLSSIRRHLISGKELENLLSETNKED